MVSTHKITSHFMSAFCPLFLSMFANLHHYLIYDPARRPTRLTCLDTMYASAIALLLDAFSIL